MTDSSVTLINSLEIISLLKRIQSSKQLVSLSFKSLPQYCLTSLLEVHADTKVLVFDEPNPQVSKKLLHSKNAAKFSLKLQNLPISFSTEMISAPQSGEVNNLYTHFPKEIYYPQSRAYYRFHTEFVHDINTTVYLSSSQRLECELINISLEGLCLRLPFSFYNVLKLNQILDDIHIQLPGEKVFSVSAKIRNSHIEKNYSNVIIGLQIQQQQQRIEKVIQQFIFRTETL